MNLNTIGGILRFYREKYNFKQSDVCNGICSISTLSRASIIMKNVLTTLLAIMKGIEKNITLNRAMFVMEYVHLWRKHEKTKDIFKK